MKQPIHSALCPRKRGVMALRMSHRSCPRRKKWLIGCWSWLESTREILFIYDLGSGEGRVVITAVRRYGAKAVGFEIDPPLVTHSRRKIREAGLEDRAEIREQDIRTVDLSPASVVALYLYPEANLALKAALMRQLKPGSRVVSHYFGMGDWKPHRIEQMTDSAGFLRSIYLWRMEDQHKG
jgi:SAM-dependent methyltransferase